MDNGEITRVLDEIADMLELDGENFFRVRAYRNAARSIGDYPAAIAALDSNQLAQIPGVGADLAAKIRTLVESGELELHRELLAKMPPGLLELRQIRGLGPRRIRLLADTLKIKSKDDLRRAADAGAIAAIRGFGKKIEEQIRQALAHDQSTTPTRTLWSDAAPMVAALLAHLRVCAATELIEPAGSFRRRRETVGDLDVLVASADPGAVMAQVHSFPQVRQKLGAGDTRTSVVLTCGIQLDVRVVPRESFGAALIYFTGSKAHCVHLRRIAQLKDLLLNEYGLFRGDAQVAGREEEDVYRALGLDWIAPELREDRGELDAAAKHRLPRLIARGDLRGDLHTHSTWTDGRASIETMARAARDAGLDYFAMTDHSKRLAMAHGLGPERLREQWREINAVARKLSGITLLRGIEVDILEDGSLDLPDDVLAELDWVVASVHSRFDQSSEEMTRRIVTAIRNPNVDVLGHPSGRLINRRASYSFDFDQVLVAARDEGCALEINSQPDRLDLTDVACLAARQAGVKVVISSDSHSAMGFAQLEHGVAQARRGWAEPADVLNTLPVNELLTRRH